MASPRRESPECVSALVFVTEHEVNDEVRAAMRSLQRVEHVTVKRLQAMLADSKPKRGGRKRVPVADGFVRVDHNNPAVVEAREKLNELVDEIDKSNTVQLAREERDALLAEIMVLLGLLQVKVVRYAHLQTALGEQSVLKYLKGSFPGEVRAGMLSVAIDRLFKALFGG